MPIDDVQISNFIDALEQYYAGHGRHNLPWRCPNTDGTFDPYKILVSEIMLQQTQVQRVIAKYGLFLSQFPDVQTLANSELGAVLRIWQGLGYNRRAKYLWLAAKQIASNGWPDDLTKLPGVGVNTAGAIRAYSFNEPVLFIETNIRTVYIHHFAADQQDVPDTLIRELLAQTLTVLTEKRKEQSAQKSPSSVGMVREDTVLSHDPRTFYWALMDYGTYLKKMYGNVNRASKHYKKQSAFAGSDRQVRGAVIRILLDGAQPLEVLRRQLDDSRLEKVIDDLVDEQLIQKKGNTYMLEDID
jgi:A/G-specific adenine glycosylase